MKKNHHKFFFYSAIILFIVIYNSFFIVRVVGDSMNPTLQNGDILIGNKICRTYSRFDIVIFKKNNQVYVKRIIGLSGERIIIEGNKVIINGIEIVENYSQGKIINFTFRGRDEVLIPEDRYFVLGDNREESMDSRGFGFIRGDEIIGIVGK